jgi:hypothetical protein
VLRATAVRLELQDFKAIKEVQVLRVLQVLEQLELPVLLEMSEPQDQPVLAELPVCKVTPELQAQLV